MFEVQEDFTGKKAPTDKFPQGEETVFKKGAKVRETDLHSETFECAFAYDWIKPVEKASNSA